MRLSPFWNWVIFYFIMITIFVLAFYIPERFSRNVVVGIFGCVIVITSIFFTEDISETFSIRYRITEKNGFLDTKIYEAHFLRLAWFILMWEPVKTKTLSYKAQNIFGAKFTEYFDTDVTFYSKKDALNAIEEHKKLTKDARIAFFKRPEKKNKKVTYL